MTKKSEFYENEGCEMITKSRNFMRTVMNL